MNFSFFGTIFVNSFEDLSCWFKFSRHFQWGFECTPQISKNMFWTKFEWFFQFLEPFMWMRFIVILTGSNVQCISNGNFDCAQHMSKTFFEQNFFGFFRFFKLFFFFESNRWKRYPGNGTFVHSNRRFDSLVNIHELLKNFFFLFKTVSLESDKFQRLLHTTDLTRPGYRTLSRDNPLKTDLTRPDLETDFE